MNQSTGYSRMQIRLHWATVVLVALQYLLHEGISEAYEVAQDTGVYALSTPVVGHAAGGMIILLLTAWRLMLRREHGAPPPPEGEPALFRRLSHAGHMSFYVLLFLLPVTGVMAWGGRIEAAGDAHEVLRAILMIVILAHVGAVLVHQFVWKTGLLRRMMRPQ
ncbi:cytochrome b/b6 domain-containing protein [Roseibacterium sp. SDUM158016]|uniref:cytochrome b n=1 Tax=Roseicyclus sediminis TaxID=2980997 RepID=UPI0021D0C4DA|nr:cytochrome b/b6 domain-containing protein [Roseibacterium sp. SDUM158016]MCU4653179.1 cytochrome b/b6 domain-containing protein [Roseibacterium sp. SDUM158016]